MNSLFLSAALLATAADPPATEPKAVPATRTEFKDALERYKKATPRLPMPPAESAEPQSRVNNGWFRSYYLSHLNTGGTGSGSGGGRRVGGGGARESDPAMTLDNTFKVKLFWVTSRANNCFY